MPLLNIALDLFGLIITLIIFFSCLEERIKKETTSSTFLFLMGGIIVTLIADMIGWIGEGNLALSTMTVVGNTVAACFGYLSIFVFIFFLKETLHGKSKTVEIIVYLVGLLCLVSIVMVSINAYNGASFYIDEAGHYVHRQGGALMITHLQFPLFAFVIILLMVFFAKDVSIRNRIVCVLYALFPTAGVIFDYAVHGWSLTYVGMVISTMIIYTNIYLQKRRIIAEQKTALTMSQINPHFMYNTLTTIASLCEINPKEAKELTIEFSSFLRQNIGTLTSTELIPFEQELRHVECYLKIEKARFKEKINVVYAIGEKDFSLPALSVQPLVENAVKHGISKKRAGGTVKISTYRTDNAILVEIKDDGVGFDPTEAPSDNRTHIGIQNVKRRLKEMCGGTMTVRSMKDVGTRVIIEIPQGKRTKRK